MINKSFLRCFLILGLVLAFAYPILNAWAEQAATPQAGAPKVIAYYFHTNTRQHLHKIEAYLTKQLNRVFRTS
jgi:hypothetical protein